MVEIKDFLFADTSIPALGPRFLFKQCWRLSFLREKWQGHEVDHSTPTRIKAKNGYWSRTLPSKSTFPDTLIKVFKMTVPPAVWRRTVGWWCIKIRKACERKQSWQTKVSIRHLLGYTEENQLKPPTVYERPRFEHRTSKTCQSTSLKPACSQ
jgi:hypothetical protein